jgi:hypothetical protein
MAAGRLPVMRAVGMAYRDVGRSLRALRGLAVIALVILLAFDLLEFLLPKGAREFPVVGLAISVARAFLLTPFLIAIHRFILIDEVTRHYVIAPHQPRFMRFFVWSLMFPALALGAALIGGLFSSVGLSSTSSLIGTWIVLIVGLVIGLRFTILFPAIAVDAPGATASNAFADTKGYALDIFLIGLVATLPLTALFIAIAPLQSNVGGLGSSIMAAAALTVSNLVAYPLCVAIASRIFQALADRVLRAKLG